MAKIFALNYDKEKTMTGVDTEDVTDVEVLVVSGDEILIIHKKNGEEIGIDGDQNGSRAVSFFDGRYTVYPEEFDSWMKRKSSYDGLLQIEEED